MTKRLPSSWSRPLLATVSYRTPTGATGVLATNGTGTQNAVNTFTVKWGRPAGYAIPQAGGLELTVEHSLAVPALPYGTRITLQLTEPGSSGSTYTAGVGWLTSYRRRTISGGRQLTTLSLEDAFSRASNTLLAAPPWPSETANERLAHINAASPTGPVLDLDGVFIDSTLYVQPRDVDSIDALDVIKRTIPFGWSLVETPAGLLRPVPPEGSQLAWTGSIYSPDRLTREVAPLVLPLSAVEDPREAVMDRSGLLTHCRVSFAEMAAGGVWTGQTLTYTDAGPAAGLYPQSTYAQDVDMGVTPEDLAGDWPTVSRIKSRAQLLTDANAAPAEHWPAQRLALGKLTADTVRALLRIESHNAGLVTLGVPGDPTYQVLAGALEYAQGLAALTVQLAPARQGLVVPLTFDAVPTRNVDQVTDTPFTQYLKDGGVLTFLQLATIGNLEDWRTKL